MKFFLDHDVPDVAGRILAAAGHEVVLLREVAPADSKDADVLEMAAESRAVLITCNRDDFLGLAKKKPHGGIIILIRRRNRAIENSKLLALIETAGEGGISENINFA